MPATGRQGERTTVALLTRRAILKPPLARYSAQCFFSGLRERIEPIEP
jgi:hypothetical protein